MTRCVLLSFRMSAVTMKSKNKYHYHYSRLNDDPTANIYMEQALQVAEAAMDQLDQVGSFEEQVGMAITYNNLSVIALKQGNFQKAIKSAKLAVTLMEP